MLIADEVHGLGARKNRLALIEEYDIRLGLSATPKRWFDEIGTNKLYKYFNDIVYEFTIKDALNTINPVTNKTYLVKYKYIPIFISLTKSEIEEYNEKTKKIISSLNNSKKEDKYEGNLENLLFQRANIQKNAVNKYDALETILNKIDGPISNTLIFVSPEQISRVMLMMKKRKIISHCFTQGEGTSPSSKYGGVSEREFIIKKFKENKYQVLVAIKCMDEGIDIPEADTAILMASSTNPREYVQRIGRVIRQSTEKREAKIYDIIIKPSMLKLDPSLRKIEQTIYQKELVRAEEIALNASNNSEAIKILYDNKIIG
jgi:superfamily II DNA or RNA helicase